MDELATQEADAAVAVPEPVAASATGELVEDQFLGAGAGSPDDMGLAFNHYTEDPAPAPPVQEALNDVATLPPEEQGQAIADMSDDEFDGLLAAVPAGGQAELESVIANCEDPQRKLKLWKDYHSTMNRREIEVPMPEGNDGMGTGKFELGGLDPQNATIAETDIEVAAEMEPLEAMGDDLTVEQVDALIARKEHEHALEMKYGINITNERTVDENGVQHLKTRADGSPIVFTGDELLAVDSALSQVPAEMYGDRLKLTEIRREEANGNGDLGVNYPDEGRIELYDAAGSPVQATKDGKVVPGGSLSRGDNPDPSLETAAPYGTYSDFEATTLHELGHSAHNANLDLLDVYSDATKHIPKAEHAEYFAQDFNHAIANPELHAENSLDAPATELSDAEKLPDTDPTKADKVAAAKVKKAEWARMYGHMRDEVFDTDTHEDEIADAMGADGATPEEVEAFRAQAARLSTPAQLDRLHQTNTHRNEIVQNMIDEGASDEEIAEFRANAAKAKTPDQLDQVRDAQLYP